MTIDVESVFERISWCAPGILIAGIMLWSTMLGFERQKRSAASPDGTYVSSGQCVAYKFAVKRDTTFYEVQCTGDKKPQAVVFLPK